MAGSRAASAGLCASLLLSAAAPVLCADPPVQVHLTFAGGPSDVASIRDAVVAEGAAVWLPYDVVVGTHAAGACDEAGELDMGVRVDRGGSRTEGRDGLGAVRFDADGVPETVVTLHAGAIASLATSVTVMGWRAWQWPAGLRNDIVARAMGRALAHELGHVLLLSPQHSGSGLMRARQSAGALTDPRRSAFGLSAAETGRMRIASRAPRRLAGRNDPAERALRCAAP